MTPLSHLAYRRSARLMAGIFLAIVMEIVFDSALHAVDVPQADSVDLRARVDDTAGVAARAAEPVPPGESGPWKDRPLINWSFGVAETLRFDVGWQSIVAGYGRMVVLEPIETKGRLCYPIISTVRSTPFFTRFYGVNDSVITLLDVRQLYPLHFEKYLREGKYRADRVADFDPDAGLAYTPTDTVAIPPYVQDALSMLYYVRALNLEPGHTVRVNHFADKDVYTLSIRVLRRERIEVKAGVFNTIVVEPMLKAAGLFKQKGRVTVWLTDDRLHLPVLMKSKVLVGSIMAELTSYRLGRIRRY